MLRPISYIISAIFSPLYFNLDKKRTPMDTFGNDAPEVVGREEAEKVAVEATTTARLGEYQANAYERHQAALSQSHLPPSQQQRELLSTLYSGQENRSKQKTACGIALPTFILAIVLALVIIGAGVGGGVGGSLAVQHARNEAAVACSVSRISTLANSLLASSTPASSISETPTRRDTSTSTSSYVTVPTYSDVSLALDCPNLTGTERDIPLGSSTYKFKLRCGVDYRSDDRGGVDILAATAYSLDDCLRACATYSFWRGSNACVAVEFSADMSTEVPKDYGNCWIKNSTGTAHSWPDSEANRYVGAELQT